MRRTDRYIELTLFAGAFAVLAATANAVGTVRDESIYFYAAESISRWLQLLFHDPGRAVSDAGIVQFFDVNHEHPVLMKGLFGLSYLIFHEGLGVAPTLAFRLPAFATAALIPVLVYKMGGGLYGRKAGLFAALSFLLVPRQFFNAHLACFDVPITTAWLFTVYMFWRAQSTKWGWLGCGVALGLSLATKHNGLFLPFILTPFALYLAWVHSETAPGARRALIRFFALCAGVGFLYLLTFVVRGPEKFQQSFELISPQALLYVGLGVGAWALLKPLWGQHEGAFRPLACLAAIAILGPLFFYGLWPYLWHHPVDRTAWYLAFHAQHNHYTWFYLGTLLRQPPFPLEYVFAVTAMTVPISLLMPMVTGLGWLAGRAALRKIRWDDALVGVNALAAILIISHPDVPHFGGVKHWFPSMPFLAILGGAAVSRASDTLEPLLRRRWAPPPWAPTAGLFALLLFPALIATWRVHPYGTSYYSEDIGGLPGAASLGMQRQFWSNNVTGVLDWLNEHAPGGARVYFHEVTGLSVRYYQQAGKLRADIQQAGGPADAQIAVYQYHQEFREQEFNIWQSFGTTQPVAGLYLDETPQIVVYRRP